MRVDSSAQEYPSTSAEEPCWIADERGVRVHPDGKDLVIGVYAGASRRAQGPVGQ